MDKSKKMALIAANLAFVVVVGFFVYQKFEVYINNPWTRDGQVRAQVIQVTPRVSGTVLDIAVVDNQHVRAGDLLFSIDTSTYEVSVEQAIANLEREKVSSKGAKVEYDRLKDIAAKDSGAVSDKDLIRREVNYQQSLSRITVAEQNLVAAKLQVEYTNVYASVDGYVSNINFQIGSQAVANQPILALVDENSFWVFGYFQESQLEAIAIDNKAVVTLMGYPDSPIEGRVESMGWGIAPSDGTVGYNLLPSIKPVFQWIRLAQRMPVRIELDSVPASVDLRFGMSASVLILAKEE
ncbi:p-hydroxybenzoic acid efflux pump subunit AaeA [Sinobacterium norvegicum]|uniref:p-hydroxybenzoic acid efflux pump subunit AaeA n=1 Tax=Sinobacterium norvegicum TaxID=1641715 RepID=A0ABN8ELL9_9GAMM|nr:HlyD family secretion protein [Sinobacterium norvegicum]CAH0992620.1 p-hydroxybenzoic acid efflux pump subunit AaeA [Sinobacterium norvegicum]